MTDCGCWGLVMSDDSGCFWLFVADWLFVIVFWVFSECYRVFLCVLGVYSGIFWCL